MVGLAMYAVMENICGSQYLLMIVYVFIDMWMDVFRMYKTDTYVHQLVLWGNRFYVEDKIARIYNYHHSLNS